MYESLPGEDDWDRVADDEVPAENVDASANEQNISQLQVFSMRKIAIIANERDYLGRSIGYSQ